MTKTRKEYTDANRVAWNEAAAKHAAHNNAALFEAFKDSGMSTGQTMERGSEVWLSWAEESMVLLPAPQAWTRGITDTFN